MSIEYVNSTFAFAFASASSFSLASTLATLAFRVPLLTPCAYCTATHTKSQQSGNRRASDVLVLLSRAALGILNKFAQCQADERQSITSRIHRELRPQEFTESYGQTLTRNSHTQQKHTQQKHTQPVERNLHDRHS
jgi:hypothetical protein